MRVISGIYRSRAIAMPQGVKIRPTQDKVREAIFNLLGDVTGTNVLELFAGSGAFGIEAISRGSKRATFVDNNFRCVQAVKSNIESLAIPETSYDIIRANALSVLSRLEKQSAIYDIVFLDPPYYEGMAKKCLINIDHYDILAQSGLVIVEHFRKDSLEADLKALVLEKERLYGDTAVSIYRKTNLC